MEKILSEFLYKCGKQIIKNELHENFILHLICLYDYQQINKDIMAKIVQQFDEIRNHKEDLNI
jgi:hypothetical protein